MSAPVVIVKEGWIRGAKLTSVLNRNYLSFKGVPFASPPVGELRFKDPQPLEPWTGIRDALVEGPWSGQLAYEDLQIKGDDDCLYLNIATTSLKGSRPVMVWIHGGGFIMGNGSADMYSPDYLMEKDIVFVSINYRLGLIGFLCLDHEAAPGNYGLKDQVAALKWIKENISQFGGDPNNITIFGESAGSASVHYHLLSPLSKGLFHKAILQSGVALNPWALVPNPVEKAHDLIAALGGTATDPIEIVEFLRTIPIHDLIKVQRGINHIDLDFAFGPTVDAKSSRPFLPTLPEELLESHGFDVPIIIGYNSDEGMIGLLGMTDEIFSDLNERLERLVPRDLVAKAPSKVSEITESIRKFYFGDRPVGPETKREFVQVLGDAQFVTGIQAVVEARRKTKTPTYLYRFSYNGTMSWFKKMIQSDYEGTCHADDLAYIFHQNMFPEVKNIEPGTSERLVLDRFIKMWTDFAKTGNPTPQIDDLVTAKWLPLSSTTKNYLEINENLVLGQNPNEEVWQHWKRIFELAKSE